MERAGGIAGYGVLTTNFFARDFVELVFVAESERRKGIGDAILDTIERARRVATGCSPRRIEISTTAMRALLERRGYSASGAIGNLDPEGAELVFVKFLRP